MGNKKICFLFIAMIILAASCLSDPETASDRAASAQAFDPNTISRAQYDSTMREVQQFIASVNQIIRNRNYSGWRNALSQEYFNEISSQEFLRRASGQPAMVSQGIVLRTPEDYFNNVVVPARANNRLDDNVDSIEFSSRDRVTAYALNANGQKLRLYELEKIGNSWKILN
jgi:hypothetical protein